MICNQKPKTREGFSISSFIAPVSMCDVSWLNRYKGNIEDSSEAG